MSELFYLQDSRSFTGANAVFWKKSGAGYATNLSESKTCTLEEAQQYHNRRNSDVPLLKSLVDEFSISAVDHQNLPEAGLTDPNDEYVVQVKDYWNGNDILFVGPTNTYTYNYSLAKTFSRKDAEKIFTNCYTIFSKASIDKIARRTFQAENIDKRKMIFNPGIKLAKPKRVRPTTGKTRGNCPVCGRITWDYNPHENAYCGDHCSSDLC